MADRRSTSTSSNNKAEVTNPFFSHIPKYQYSSSPPAASNHHMQLSASPPVNVAPASLLDHRLHDQPSQHPHSYISSSYEPNHITSSIPIYHQSHQQQPSLISSSPKNQFLYSNSNTVRKSSMSASPPPHQSQQQSGMVQPTVYLERTGSGKGTYGSGTYGRAHHEKLPPCKPDVIDNATKLDAGATAANGKGTSDALREDQGTIIKHRFT